MLNTKIPPTIEHINIAVRDIDKTIQLLSSVWDIGPWLNWEYSPSAEAKSGKTFAIRGAWTRLGPVVLELTQPLTGKSPCSEILENKGEGLHHLAFIVPNWEEIVEELQGRGCKVVGKGVFADGKRYCLFELDPGGLIVEIGEEGLHGELHKKLSQQSDGNQEIS